MFTLGHHSRQIVVDGRPSICKLPVRLIARTLRCTARAPLFLQGTASDAPAMLAPRPLHGNRFEISGKRRGVHER